MSLSGKLVLVLVIVTTAKLWDCEASPLDVDRNLKQILGNAQQEQNQIAPMLENEDSKLTVPEIIAKYQYPIEVHDITTADGYIIQAHRIPHGKNMAPAENRPVVWLQHGFMGDSSNWIMNTEEKALAFRMANFGFDVWLGNARGNTYSKNHVSLSASDPAFWKFSWHEMGVYDLPAAIDYVLATTGNDDLYYVGHSMGSTMFWVLLSEYPEYNSKIRLMSAFAPVAFVDHMISPVSLLAPLANSLEDILDFLGIGELLPTSPIMDFMGATLCNDQSAFKFLCSNLLFLLAGYDSEQHNSTMLPIIMGHSPAGVSTRTVVHFAQGINTGLFRKFNHGKTKNLELYGQPTPPEYKLDNIACPVALYWSQNDWIGSPADVYRLSERLPSLVKKYRIPFDKYNHLDFIFAIDNNNLINDNFMEFIKYF